MAVNTLIQIRRGTASLWETNNPVLSNGEWGYETDTGRIKIGDSLSTAWNSLPYAKLRYDDIITGSGVSITELTNSNSQVTGLSISTNLVAGSNITLTESAGAITIAGSSPTTVSQGTGIVVVQTDDDYEINADYTNSDFITAVDNRVTAGSVSPEQVMDIVGASGVGVSGVHSWYDDGGTGKLYFSVTGLNLDAIGDVTATPAEVNLLDGDTSTVSITLTGTDGVIVNDGGTMKLVQVGDFGAYEKDVSRTLTNKTIDGNNNTLQNINVTSLSASGITVGSTTINLGGTATTIAGLDSVTSTTFVGDLQGNADTASQVKTQQGSTDAVHYIAFVDSDNGSATAETVYTDAGLTYNPSSNNLNVGNNLTVQGDLTVQGTTTTVNSTTVDIGDNIIQVNVSGAETLGGIAMLDHDSGETFQIVYDNVDTRFEFMSNSGTAPDVFTSGDLSANILTSTVSDGTAPLSVTSTTVVTNLNADKLDGEDGSYYLAWGNTTGKPSPIISGALTGDVTGSASVTLTELGNGTLSISTTLENNTVTSDKIVDGTILDADINNSAGINVTKLSASGVTIGSTTINLGGTSTSLASMTAIGGVSGTPMTITYATIDGGSP